MKLCECGCGNPAPIAKAPNKRLGHIKGKPVRFILGHHARLQPIGSKAYRWNGGKSKMNDGRVLIKSKKHHGYVLQSILIAEQTLGKPLPFKVLVHHFDGNPGNDYKNLIICENQAYHGLLHQRERAYTTCGHANWRKCYICKFYDDPKNLYITPKGNTAWHKQCRNKKRKELIEKAQERMKRF